MRFLFAVAILLLASTTAQAELVKGTKPYQNRTYLAETQRAQPQPPVPAVAETKDPAAIEPAAGEEVEARRPYEPVRNLREDMKLPRKD